MIMAVLKVAVIGLGNMGRHHVKQWASLPGVELVAVCDLNQDAVDRFSSEYHCAGFTEVSTMIAQAKPDAVSIISPTQAHFSLAKQALEAGVHVLVEKPITATVEEADQLIESAKRHQRFLTVGHIERFNPVVHAALSVIHSGKLGDIVSVVATRVSPMPAQIKGDNVVMDLAVHDIDLCNVLMDQAPLSIAGKADQVMLQDRSDHAQLFLTYPKGSAMIQVSWISPTRRRGFWVTGSAGVLEADTFKGTLTLWGSDGESTPIQIQPGDALALELAHFRDAIVSNTRPWVTPEAARDVLKMALLF
jgi:UDP-N-acetylglucosamine 3-dehydrogenase